MKPAPRPARQRAVRAAAVLLAFAWDSKGETDDGHLCIDEDELELDQAGREQARALFDDLLRELPAIDALLQQHLRGWTVSRLAQTDRCLLRLGITELCYRPERSLAVVINDYVELAKRYGSQDRTAKLLNGVLDAVARSQRGDQVISSPSGSTDCDGS